MRTLLRCAAAFLLTPPLAAQNASQPIAQGLDHTPVLHTSARLVVVDVTVIDAHGVPVHGLDRSAFHLTESRHPQTIRSFEEHSSALNAAAAASMPALQPGVFTNLASTLPQSPPVILLLDMLNTPMQNQAWVQKKLLDYLSTTPPNTRIAIFSLASGLTLLQGFTSDPALLRSAVEHVHPQASPILGEKIGGQADMVSNMQRAICPGDPITCEVFGEAEENTDSAQRASITLHAFHQLALYLANQPGRKNLIWFSSAFPLSLMLSDDKLLIPGIASADSRVGDSPWREESRKTMDLLARSRVVIYPFDARGVAFRNGGNPTETKAALFETQTGMYEMADDSGGQAFVNTNGLAQAVQEVIDNGASYYTLSYTPSDANPHGEFRPIAIKLENSSGYKLAYRRGYYAEGADTLTKSSPSSTTGSAMQSASSYLAAPSTQIAFFARVLPMPADAADVVAPGSEPRATPVAASSGAANSRRFSIEYSSDLRNFSTSTTEDGVHHAHLEFIALVYDSQGRIIRSDVKPVRIAWTPAQFTEALQHGVRYQQQISLPADGSSTLRLFIHDLSTDHVGSLDIPAAGLKTN